MIRHPKTPSGTVHIGLFSSIETSTAEHLVDTICNKIPSDTKTLHFLFSASGGSVSAGFIIYNFLASVPYKIIMHTIGSVDSIGLIVYLAGTQRYCTDNATFLIHGVTTKLSSNATEESPIEEKLNCIKKEQEKIAHILLQRSKLKAKEVERLFEHGKLEDADFAVRKELAHEIRACPYPNDHFYLVSK